MPLLSLLLYNCWMEGMEAKKIKAKYNVTFQALAQEVVWDEEGMDIFLTWGGGAVVVVVGVRRK